MKRATVKRSRSSSDSMQAEYDFGLGIRGRHYKAMQAGYTVTIHKADGSRIVKHVKHGKGTVILDSDIQPFFPDSQSVNQTLRSLINLIPARHKGITNRGPSCQWKTA